ncbi:amidohydrolase family protein [Roseomonas populi]|uniref:Amidohydrolase family protein n=1 Tax=Roseomonas populi TaxID=3121582 RepID=A0ABT1XBN3_9PROT|nr:amidohydrolase family protein [Roseomonas pecuniae]MCR0985334.1 amidohydrolase family protein [Roseomonas pecuniae]
MEPLIDSHFHIFDPAFPSPGNQGFIPDPFLAAGYLKAAGALGIVGGVLVAASTHGLDPAPVLAPLAELGRSYVAVLNADPAWDDETFRRVAEAGARGLRFNLYRGVSGSEEDAVALARRARAVAGLHAQVYVDFATMRPQMDALISLGDGLVIDHLGMTEAGLPLVLELVSAGAMVKATGFGRVSLDVRNALERIERQRPGALMFGTDLPSVRARRPFDAADVALIQDVLGPDRARSVLHDAAAEYYGIAPKEP